LFLIGATITSVAVPVGVADDKPTPPHPEVRAVKFGGDEAADTKRLAELTADGWVYVGPLSPGTVAFRRSVPARMSGDVAKLQGVWVTTSTEKDGVRDTPDSRHVFVGNRYFVIDKDRVTEDGTFTIDASGPVKKIDFKCLRGDYEGHTWKGVYELEGDTYRHFGPWGLKNWENRPEKFSVKTDANTWLRALKRESR